MKKAWVNLLLLILFGLPLSAQDQLPRSSPQKEGVNASGILKFLEAVEGSSYEFHSLMILRNGKVIAEGWWHPYEPALKHTMYSVSKSFTATAIGFAVDEGRLSVDDKVISFFPDQLPDSVSLHLQALSIQHLLTMSVGHGQDPTWQVVSSDHWAEAFLNTPIPNAPGSKFLYNTAATYMLSAILQKVTGQTLLDYLTPRLFKPLGISGMDWEPDPHGIHTGGYGLRLKTEDMAKFGQLFLQKGQWQDKQVLPVGWVEEASSAKIIQDPGAPQEQVEQSDWLQGYGYQMWRSRHHSFRADGAFGQYILVLPELEAVIAITSETGDMQGELNLVWEHLLPAFDQPAPSGDKELSRVLAALALDPLRVGAHQEMQLRLDGQWFRAERESFILDFQGDTVFLNIKTDENSFRFQFGSGAWVLGETDRKGPYLVSGAKGYLSGLESFKTAGSYTWADDTTLALQLRYLESPHTQIIRMIFDKEGAVMEIGNSFQEHRTKVVFEALVDEEVE